MSVHCERCGQANYLPNLTKKLTTENAVMVERMVEAAGIILDELKDLGQCDCGFDEPVGEGYTGGTCRLHQAIQLLTDAPETSRRGRKP